MKALRGNLIGVDCVKFGNNHPINQKGMESIYTKKK